MKVELVRRARMGALACAVLAAGVFAAWLSARTATGATTLLDGPGAAVYSGGNENQVFFRGDDAGISHSY